MAVGGQVAAETIWLCSSAKITFNCLYGSPPGVNHHRGAGTVNGSCQSMGWAAGIMGTNCQLGL